MGKESPTISITLQVDAASARCSGATAATTGTVQARYEGYFRQGRETVRDGRRERIRFHFFFYGNDYQLVNKTNRSQTNAWPDLYASHGSAIGPTSSGRGQASGLKRLAASRASIFSLCGDRGIFPWIWMDPV